MPAATDAQRGFGAVFSVGAQQLRIGSIVHSPSRRRGNRTGDKEEGVRRKDAKARSRKEQSQRIESISPGLDRASGTTLGQ